MREYQFKPLDRVKIVRNGAVISDNRYIADRLCLDNYAGSRGMNSGDLKNGMTGVIHSTDYSSAGNLIVVTLDNDGYQYVMGEHGAELIEARTGVLSTEVAMEFYKPIAVTKEGIITRMDGNYMILFQRTGHSRKLTENEVIKLEKWLNPLDPKLFEL